MATGCDSSSSCSSNNDISYLILGDGDFSFSYDLARRILLEKSSSSSSSFHVTASGIDTLQEVESKYKDSAFLLKKLKGLNNKDHHHHLTVSVQHGVNAILPIAALQQQQPNEEESGVVPFVQDDNDDKDTTTTFCHSHSNPQPADIVLFNHPHLGLEDSNLHSCFLAHLLDSVDRYWLKSSSNNNNNNNRYRHGGVGMFFLTLALGQWERWKGDEAAARLGLFIVNRLPFQTPLAAQIPVATVAQAENAAAAAADDDDVPVVDEKPYFQLRRHQTGKSFANRRKANASETFALGRLAEKDFLPPQNSSTLGRLFWYSSAVHTVNTETMTTTTMTTTTPFSCPFCDRTFSEQRSVKNHIRSKHVNDQEQKNGNSISTSMMKKDINDVVEQQQKHKEQHQSPPPPPQEWECPYCTNNNTTTTTTNNNNNHVSNKRPRRVFDHQQALNDHIKAKHQALHAHIPPDYQTTSAAAAAAADAAIAKVVSEQQQQQSVSLAAVATVATTTGGVPQPFGCCDICLQVFDNAHVERCHMDCFIPSPTTITAPVSSSKLDTALKQQFACCFCAKAFREKRARLQHENLCAFRPEVTLGQS